MFEFKSDIMDQPEIEPVTLVDKVKANSLHHACPGHEAWGPKFNPQLLQSTRLDS